MAPVFVDAYEEPGKLLYRFDAVIANQGGTLDLFRGPAGGVEQAIYQGGEPPVAPKPDETPSGGVELGAGASLVYAKEKTHQHWHFSSAARYSVVAGGTTRVSDKVGFCMFDSFGPAHWFAYSVQGAAGERWCRPNEPTASTVRMGLSPGGADIYTAQLERQWVDITGLDPGRVVVRGEANPLHCVLESNSANNDTQVTREIPGVRAADVSGGSSVSLSGVVVAPQVPARRSGGCVPGAGSKSCYVWASAAGPLRFSVTREPSHGTIGLAPGADGLHALATYTPVAGYSGPDSFSYVATDLRGLTSRPATAHVVGSHSLTRRRFAWFAAALEGAGRPPARPLAAPAPELRVRPDLRPARAEAREVAGRAPPPRPDPRSGTESHRARPRPARALPPGPACERAGRGAGPVPRALLDWKAAWLPSDTSTWAGFRSAGAPRSSSRR